MATSAVIDVEWGKPGANRAAMRALRNGDQLRLVCHGWRARLLRNFLPRYLDDHSKLGIRDFLVHMALIRIVTVCTYGYGRRRSIEVSERGAALEVLFK